MLLVKDSFGSIAAFFLRVPRASLAPISGLDSWIGGAMAFLGTHPQFHDLSPLQEPSSFEDRRHRLLDPRGPRPRLLRAGEVKQVSPLPTRRQRLERALEPRIVAELLLQLLGHRKLWGLRLDLHSSLPDRHGLAHVGLDGGRLRRNLLCAGELHHPRCLNLPELDQQASSGPSAAHPERSPTRNML